MALPAEYVNQMRELLGEEEFADFMASYGEPKRTAIRLNGLKARSGGAETEGAKAFVRGREAVPWAEGAYYTDESERPGKHPYYDAGLYYIQEPSAMLPAELLAPVPGDRVLDLCAAPGGKSTQLAAKLDGTGLLVTNDLATDRTKALAKNIERAGIACAVVTNETPARLAEFFGATFDRVLVDAPCSGEGMFRKDEGMIRQWDGGAPARYAAMQDEIMREAAKLVAPGGRLVYSTCTFSPVENEGTIARFLAEHDQFEIVRPDFPGEWGFAPGRPDWLAPQEAAALGPERAAQLSGTIRLWPHRVRGEGHYAALLRRTGGAAGGEPAAAGHSDAGSGGGEPAAGRRPAEPDEAGAAGKGRSGSSPRPSEAGRSARSAAPSHDRHRRGGREADRRGAEGRRGGQPDRAANANADADALALSRFEAFVRESLPGWSPPGKIVVQGDYVYSAQEPGRALKGLRLVRGGWLLGKATKHRFEPSQALAMGLSPDRAALSLRLVGGDEDAVRYLKGETLQPQPGSISGPDGKPADGRGWTLVCLDGYPLGWGRWDGSLLKNELLPGWRRI